MTPEDGPVAVIGLGNLGLAMAGRLASAGWTVLGVDPSSDRRRLAEQRGITPAEASDLEDCGVLCFVVPDETAIREVLVDGGLLDMLGADHLVLSHSTILPSHVQELAADVAATGARFLEVPVSGGAQRAERGELTLLVAGDPAVIDDARPLLEVLGRDVVLVGDIGAAAAAKLANQLVTFATQTALVEALRLTAAYGVEERAVLTALSTATGDTWVGRNWGFFDGLAADYDDAGVPPGARPWAKDTREILDAAAERGLDLPLARLVAGSIGTVIDGRSSVEGDVA